MPEVTRSTSQRGSLVSDASQSRMPDLRSWQGLTEVLKLARDSGLSRAEYAEFRDLVLQYAQQGGDAELRKKIDFVVRGLYAQQEAQKVAIQPTSTTETEKILEHAMTQANEPTVTPKDAIPAEQAKEETSTVEQVPFRRRVPSFLPKNIKLAPTQTTTPIEEQAPEVSTPSEPLEANIPEVSQIQTVEQTPAPDLASEPAAEPIPVSENVTPPPPSVALPPESPVSQESSFDTQGVTRTIKSVTEHRERIAEIKRIVNSLVGNTVMLVSENGALGRTYMTALLTAMKATAPGATQDIEDAMRALEESFAAIEAHVATQHGAQHIAATHEETTVSSVSTPQISEPVVPLVEQKVEIVHSASETTPSEAPIPAQSASVVEMSPAQEDVVTPTPVLVPEILTDLPEESLNAENVNAFEPVVASQPEVITLEAPEVSQDIEQQLISEASPVSTPSATREQEPVSVVELKEELVQNETKPEVTKTPTAVRTDIDRAYVREAVEKAKQEFNVRAHSQGNPFPSILDIGADTPPPVPRGNAIPIVPQTPHSEVPVTPLTPTQTPAELMTPEITTALNSLLHEWNIFASSGLFGIGPGGMDHPLYKKLSPIAMSEIIKGNFEGSTLELVRVIKDYIDAWRHEQGIAYNPQESFEQYLRRVIQRIMKRQKGEKVV